MFYSVGEISIMAKAHENDMRYMRECCRKTEGRKNSGANRRRRSGLIAMLISKFSI